MGLILYFVLKGLELAQSMARFGSKVVVFGRSGQILEKEDRDAVAIVQKQLVEDGIEFKLLCKYNKIQKAGDAIAINVTNDGVDVRSIDGDPIYY